MITEHTWQVQVFIFGIWTRYAEKHNSLKLAETCIKVDLKDPEPGTVRIIEEKQETIYHEVKL